MPAPRPVLRAPRGRWALFRRRDRVHAPPRAANSVAGVRGIFSSPGGRSADVRDAGFSASISFSGYSNSSNLAQWYEIMINETYKWGTEGWGGHITVRPARTYAPGLSR